MLNILTTIRRSAPLVLGLVLALGDLSSSHIQHIAPQKQVSRQLASKFEISGYELNHEIQVRLFRVHEFKLLLEESQRMGVKVYLFGGTASAFAHYVRWDLMREKGDARFQGNRFDYDFTNIYRSTQDLDVVVDGSADKIEELQNTLQTKFPYLQGNKDAWEVRSLRENYKKNMALLNNPDFLNQHTDSNSTGTIEITDKPGQVVYDLRDWNNPSSQFLKDIAEGKVHYYFSDLHGTTVKAKIGENPPIFSAIRLLIKAVQFELEIRPEDQDKIKQIIRDFNPKDYPARSYVNQWIEKNAKKLVLNAVNIEYALNLIEQMELKQKLINLNGDKNAVESLAWWMAKEPLRTHEVGTGSGKTARELGIDVVAHETKSFAAFESITKAHTGDANVLISRKTTAGETAIYGDGFYTRMGRKGAIGTGLTVRFQVRSDAREGTDFLYVKSEGYIVFFNKEALRVIPESLNYGVLDYLNYLKNEKLEKSDRGILEKVKRRVLNSTYRVSADDVAEIDNLIQQEINLIQKGKGSTAALLAWMDLPISNENMKLKSKATETILGTKHTYLESIDLFKKASDFREIPRAPKEFIKVLKMYKKNSDSGTVSRFTEEIMSKPGLVGNLEILEFLMSKDGLDIASAAFSSIDDFNKYPGSEALLHKFIKSLGIMSRWSGVHRGNYQEKQNTIFYLMKKIFPKPGIAGNTKILNTLIEAGSGSAALEGFSYFEDFNKSRSLIDSAAISTNDKKAKGFFRSLFIKNNMKPPPSLEDILDSLINGFVPNPDYIAEIRSKAFPKVSPEAQANVIEMWQRRGFKVAPLKSMSCDSTLSQ